jgi:hypothetical protein
MNESIDLHIPRQYFHKAKRPCMIGDANDRLELFLLLRSLPQEWTATIKTTTRRGYSHLMEISHLIRLGRGPMHCQLICSLYFEITFHQFALFLPDNWIVQRDALPTPILQSDKPGYEWRLRFMLSEGLADLARPASGLISHPYYRLSSWLSVLAGRAEVPPAVLSGLTPHKRALAFRIAKNRRDRQLFMKTLTKLIGGSVKVLISSTPDTKMERISEGKFLYAATGIFPWAVDLLSRAPNCLMLDATFKCCRPYTLAILHAVFANESIPIALGLAPTETAESYERLYGHLREILLKFPPSIREKLPQSIHIEELPGPDPRVLREFEYADGGDSPDLPIRDPEAREEEQAVEEAVEGETPAEEAVEGDDTSMQEDPNGIFLALLASLPLLTDQGTAIRSLTKKYNLIWRLCHRHIIESVGASGPIGLWVAHILRCYSLEEYRRICVLVRQQAETFKHTYRRDSPAYLTLRRLLGELHDDHPLSDPKTWALWERLGCPRTTNAIESVHGHLNHDTRGMRDFMERLTRVVQHLRRRYDTRNQWRDRSLLRNLYQCFPPSPHQDTESAAKETFFRAMHNAQDLTGPIRRQFP